MSGGPRMADSIIRRRGCVLVLATFVFVLLSAGSAAAITFSAGYENENTLTNPGDVSPGVKGIRAQIWTPSVYPVYHEGTMKAVVELYFSNAANTWYARSGWKTNIGYNTPEAYWEGFDGNHAYLSWGYGALQMGSGQEYKVYPRNLNGEYKLYIGGSFKQNVYMGTNLALPAYGYSRASGSYNDLRAKFINTQQLMYYNPDTWVNMGFFFKDRAVSPQIGGPYYREALLPGAYLKDDFTVWNTMYGQYQ